MIWLICIPHNSFLSVINQNGITFIESSHESNVINCVITTGISPITFFSRDVKPLWHRMDLLSNRWQCVTKLTVPCIKREQWLWTTSSSHIRPSSHSSPAPLLKVMVFGDPSFISFFFFFPLLLLLLLLSSHWVCSIGELFYWLTWILGCHIRKWGPQTGSAIH